MLSRSLLSAAIAVPIADAGLSSAAIAAPTVDAGLSHRDSLVLLQRQADAKTTLLRGDVASSAASGLGMTAPVSEGGYEQVANLKDNEEMKAFIERVMKWEARVVNDESELRGLVPYYSGVSGKQSLERLKQELRQVSWVGNGLGRAAPLDEDGYQQVAALKDRHHMTAFARRILDANRRKCNDEGSLTGMMPYFDGALSVQSYDRLSQELLSAPWAVDRSEPIGMAQTSSMIATSKSDGASNETSVDGGVQEGNIQDETKTSVQTEAVESKSDGASNETVVDAAANEDTVEKVENSNEGESRATVETIAVDVGAESESKASVDGSTSVSDEGSLEFQSQVGVSESSGSSAEEGAQGHGKMECPCIGIDGNSGEVNITMDGDIASYPADLGSRCEAWDDDRHPTACQDGGELGKGQGFCAQKWCYVDACSCDSGLPMKATYLKQTTYKGRPLYYSYATCGGEDTYSMWKAQHAANKKKSAAPKNEKEIVGKDEEISKHGDVRKVASRESDGHEEESNSTKSEWTWPWKKPEEDAATSSSETVATKTDTNDSKADSADGVAKSEGKASVGTGDGAKRATSPSETVATKTDTNDSKADSIDGGAKREGKAAVGTGDGAKSEAEASGGSGDGAKSEAKASDWKVSAGNGEGFKSDWKASGGNDEGAKSVSEESAKKADREWKPSKAGVNGKGDSDGGSWPVAEKKSNDGGGEGDEGRKVNADEKESGADDLKKDDESKVQSNASADGEWKADDPDKTDKSKKRHNYENGAWNEEKKAEWQAIKSAKKAKREADAGRDGGKWTEEKKAEWQAVKSAIKEKIANDNKQWQADSKDKVVDKQASTDSAPTKEGESPASTASKEDGNTASSPAKKEATEEGAWISPANISSSEEKNDSHPADGVDSVKDPGEKQVTTEAQPIADKEANKDVPKIEHIKSEPKNEQTKQEMKDVDVDVKGGALDGDAQVEVEMPAEEVDAELEAMCSAPIDAKSAGKSGCMCIGMANLPGTVKVQTGKNSTVDYPADVGGSCSSWDKERHPECTRKSKNVPDWCHESWCYVDPCSCNQKAVMSGKTSGYLPKSNFEGRPLYYSYKACGSVDLWTAKNNQDACMNKEEKECTGGCLWTGSQCTDQQLSSVCEVERSNSFGVKSVTKVLLAAVVASVAAYV